ncbi:SHY1 [Auxenochlorella protothecoides x Auxenochlorella symbiontica]
MSFMVLRTMRLPGLAARCEQGITSGTLKAATRALEEAVAALGLRATQGTPRPPPISSRAFASQPHSVPAPRSGGVAARSGSGSRRTPWSAALLGIPSLLAAYLGNWQLERRQWKMRLLEERREQLLAEPIDLFAVDELPPEYSRVTLTGTYDHAKAAFVGPRGRPSSAGVTEQSYLVVTPLTSADGKRTALVNRGWVPLSWRTDPEERRVGEPSGQVTVVGVVRHGERAGQFVPPNDLEACTWYYVNTAELAQAAGRDADTPLVEAILGEGGRRGAGLSAVVRGPGAWGRGQQGAGSKCGLLQHVALLG